MIEKYNSYYDSRLIKHYGHILFLYVYRVFKRQNRKIKFNDLYSIYWGSTKEQAEFWYDMIDQLLYLSTIDTLTFKDCEILELRD